MFGEAGNDNRLLSAWLRPGHSRSDPDGGWRNFLLDDIENPQLLDETFAGPREGYAPHDRSMATVFAELATTADDAPVARATLTRSSFLSACTVLITITGQEKRDLLEQAIADGQSSKLPIGRVLAEADQPIDIHWCP